MLIEKMPCLRTTLQATRVVFVYVAEADFGKELAHKRGREGGKPLDSGIA